MSVKTVKVRNVSHKASERELKEFFSFSGDIEYVEKNSEDEETLTAYVTFKDSQGADTAVMLTLEKGYCLFNFSPKEGLIFIVEGATIVDKTVSISLDPAYELPPEALAQASEGQNPPSALRKAEDVVSSMLAKGFILGKDAVGKAKSLDEKHQLTSTASLKITSLDQKIGFTEKISMGTSAVNNKVKEIDEKFQVSEKTKSAFAVAEEKVGNAGSAVMKNRYILTGATWVTGAFNKVTKAAGEVGEKTKEKLGMVDDEQKRKDVDDFAQVHLSVSDSPKAVAPDVSSSPKESVQSVQQPTKPEPAQGLIL